MSLSLCILGSGSAGNCTVVALREGAGRQIILIDAGLSPRMTARRMAPLSLKLDQITCVLLTHLDSDHFHCGWVTAAPRLGLTFILHERHGLNATAVVPRPVRTFDRSVRLSDRTLVRSLHLPHDESGSTGFLIEHGGVRVGYATDLGHVPDRLLSTFKELDALAIESNYDPEMELASSRPAFLKQRIMGGAGHLSNEQSLNAVLHIAGQSPLEHVALLHLSRQCNDPKLIRKLYRTHAAHLLGRLTIASQHAPTPMLHVGGGADQQGMLFDVAHAGARV